MSRFLFLSLLLSLFFLPACRDTAPGEEAESAEGFTFDWLAIADQLLAQADLQAGERVLLVAQPGDFDSLIPLLRERIQQAQAVDLGVISVRGVALADWQTDFTREAAGKDREALAGQFQEVDLGIMLPGPTSTDTAYAAMQDVLQNGKGRTIHFHWAGAYDLNGQLLPLNDTINATYQRVLLETDYDALARAQQALEAAMRGQVIQVTTPQGTDIQFEIGDRPVTRQDGNASAARAAQGRNLIDREIELPAGAVRVAPMESTVQGKIAFPAADWNGIRVEGLVLTFENGKVTDWSASTGMEGVLAVFREQGEVARSFREFALGMNPLLAIPTEGEAWIPYYGYGAGVVRLSLGDNTELGGKVSGGYVRWNFFPDATVTIGDEVWVRDGKLMKDL